MRKVLVILGQLKDPDVEWMAQAGTKRSVSDGARIIEEGVRSQSLYILLDGQLRIEDSKIGTIATLGTGEIVGEMSFVDDAPPSASVIAEGECSVLELSHASLEARMDADPAFGKRLYRALCFFLADRLRGTVQRLGYGDTGSLDGEDVLADELDERLLDSVSIAGERFDRMLRTLATAPSE